MNSSNEKNNAARTELKLQELKNILPQVLGEYDEALFERVRHFMDWEELLGNQYLFHQGDEENGIFILVSGRLHVIYRKKDGSEKVVGKITRGETVGEMSIFTGKPRSAGIRAVRDSVLVKISKANFEKMIALHPPLVMNISRLVIERLKRRNLTDHSFYKVVNIAILPISKNVDLDSFSKLFKKKIEHHGTAMHLSNQSVSALLQKNNISKIPPNNNSYHRISTWLDEQESKNDYLIYQADLEPTEWTKRCLRQADKVLLVANSNDSPSLKPMEINLLLADNKITRASQILILQHDNDLSEIEDTDDWIKPRNLQIHHHIQKESEEDMERIARFLTGNAIGLVLSGGGAKGLAHIGIYKALKEKGITIDMVGGTSIGSIVAGLIGLHGSYQKVYEITRKAFLSNPTPWTDYNILPFISLLKGKKLNKLLMDSFGKKRIEDLPINFFCVSSNLSTTNADVHKIGSLRKAIRASISLPGIFPPVLLKDDLHVDGGIFNNLPIDIMESSNIQKIIAVDLDQRPNQKISLKSIPSSWQFLKQKFSKKGSANPPTLISTIISASTINSTQKTRALRKRASLVFNPDLKKFGFIEWKSFDQIVKKGYLNGKEVLEDWDGFG